MNIMHGQLVHGHRRRRCNDPTPVNNSHADLPTYLTRKHSPRRVSGMNIHTHNINILDTQLLWLQSYNNTTNYIVVYVATYLNA